MDELIRLYPRMRARALFLTQKPEAADDLVQQVCEKALRAQATFKPGTDAAAWLHRVMRNLFIDQYRSARDVVELRDEQQAEPEQALEPFDLLTLDDVRQAMTTLQPLEREILELAHIQRYSYRAISTQMRITKETTGIRLFRARAKLKQPLEIIYQRRVADLRRHAVVVDDVNRQMFTTRT